MTNYYAPQFSVKVNGSELNSDISQLVQTIQVVRDVDSSKDHCTLEISNAAPKMRWTHTDDAHLFWIGGEILVQMGYVDGLHEVMMGTITSVKAKFPNNAMPTVSITGTSRVQKLHGDQKTKTFTGQSVKNIVETIGQEVGLKVEADDPGLSYDYKIQANQTDWEFLYEIADFLHYEIFVKEETLYFRKAKEADQYAYTFVWSPSGVFSSAPNTVPLKSFEPVADTLSQQSTVVETRWYNPKTKDVIVGTSSSADVNSQGGSQTGVSLRQQQVGSNKKTDVKTPVSSKDAADKRSKSEMDKSSQKYVVGTAHTVGIPDLLPGVVVNVEGVGLFSGPYYVGNVTHTIGSSGYTTDFDLQRSSTNAK